MKLTWVYTLAQPQSQLAPKKHSILMRTFNTIILRKTPKIYGNFTAAIGQPTEEEEEEVWDTWPAKFFQNPPSEGTIKQLREMFPYSSAVLRMSQFLAEALN